MAKKEKAAESPQIAKARKKLEKQMDKERKLMSPEKLKVATDQIYAWINRYAGERVNLRDKNVELFDANKHPAAPSSQFISQLRKTLMESTHPVSASAKEPEETEATGRDLKGRISNDQTPPGKPGDKKKS